MSDVLIPETVIAAGYFGLNTEESSASLPNSFALELDNAVIDTFGRIGARKGINKASTNDYTGLVGLIHESVSTNGVRDIVSVSSKSFYKGLPNNVLKFTHPQAVGNNWIGVTLNNHAFYFQRGFKPVVYDISTDTVGLVENHPQYLGTIPLANAALSAFGRLWVADTNTNKSILYYSDTLIGHKWTGGSSGFIDLTTVFPNGGDEIVSLATFNNRLVIFARKSIIIYTGADDPTTMVVEDSLDTLGCIARDSVQDSGADIMFLSSTGLKSLGRVVQERSNPINDLSSNVRTVFVNEFSGENMEAIRSAYSEKENMYVISLPTFQRVWVFSTKQALETGALKASTWSGKSIYSFLAATDKNLYMGDSFSEVSVYGGYSDRGQAYTFSYLSNHLNSGDSSIVKILKKLNLIVIGGALQLIVKFGTNYSNSLKPVAVPITQTTTVFEYGVSEYNVAEYGSGFNNQIIQQNIGGSGSVYQVGIQATINGSLFSLQQMLIKFKKGRLF